MTLIYTAFEKAIAQFKKSLQFLNSEASKEDNELRRQFRGAVIQAFEYTYELGIKMIRRQLKQMVPNPGAVNEMDFMVLIRTAAEAGLVRDATPFKTYREKRNQTSHTYDEEEAEDILSITEAFLHDMLFLLKELKRRNPPS